MAFKKIKGSEGETIIETKVVEGFSNRLLSRWKVLKEDFPSVVKILNEKFDLKMKITREKKEDRDLEWLK